MASGDRQICSPQQKRERGSGRIFLRGRTYWAAYFLRGKEIRESAKTRDVKDAARFLRSRVKEIHADQLGLRKFVTPAESKASVADLLDALRRDFKLAGKLSTQNASNIKRVEDHFGDMRATEVTADKVSAYIEEQREREVRPASINRRTQLLQQAFRLALADDKIAKVPRVRKLKEDNIRTGFFEAEEVASLIANLPADLHDVVRFAHATGMRAKSVRAVRWEHVHDDGLTLPGQFTKNKKPLALPFTDPNGKTNTIGEIFDRRREARIIKMPDGSTRISQFVFHRGDGKQIGSIKRAWQTAAIKAGLGKMVCRVCEREGTAKICCKRACVYSGRLFHDLRRSAVRDMIRAGVPQAVAMKISGHKTDSIFRRYDITDPRDLQEALAQTRKYRETSRTKVVAMAGRRRGRSVA